MKLEKNIIAISKEKLVEILDDEVSSDDCSHCMFDRILGENLNEDFELKWD